jgi:hypothetical protein
MPNQPVYDLDAAAWRLPAGFLLTRPSSAWRDDGGRWAEVRAHVPRFGCWGLAIEGARTNRLPCSLQGPGTDWSGADLFAYAGRPPAVTGMSEPQAPAWEHRGLLGDDAPARTLAPPPSAPDDLFPTSLSAVVERLDGMPAELAVTDAAGAFQRLVGSDGGSLGTGWARVAPRGVGDAGGPLTELALAVARTAGQGLAALPSGRQPESWGCVLHHLQWEPGPFASSPILTTVGSVGRAEDVLAAALQPGTGNAATVAIAGRAAPGVDVVDQVWWQVDDGTDASRVTLRRDAGRHLQLEVFVTNLVARVDLGVLADGATFAVAFRIGVADLSVSRDGGPATRATTGGMPSTSFERLGGGLAPGVACFGHLARARRWWSPATDAELPGLATWTGILPQAAGSPPS